MTDIPWTDEEIADMEADDGRDRLMPLHFRRQVAGGMREQNAAARRWAGPLSGEDE